VENKNQKDLEAYLMMAMLHKLLEDTVAEAIAVPEEIRGEQFCLAA
jgi:hypothetical protein